MHRVFGTSIVAALAFSSGFAKPQDAVRPEEEQRRPDVAQAQAPQPSDSPEKLAELADLAQRQARELAERAANAFDRRGADHFRAARFAASLADFDRAVELDPARAPWHWRRGISCYYAGKYDDGKRQFEGYQTVDSSDVENAAWRFLCMAREHGVETARQEILRIGDDRRVPMREIWELYAGKLTPEAVLAAAQAGEPSPDALRSRLFYAHLYLGLYWEVLAKRELARKHLLLAAGEYRITHYMGDVARVHADLYREAPPRDDDKEAGKEAGKEPGN